MSVALMITGKRGSEVSLYVPVATQEGYHNICVPLAATLGLKWLPLFETGATVPPEHVSDVASEFRTLRDRLGEDPSLQAFAERLEHVVDALEQYIGRDDVEVVIG